MEPLRRGFAGFTTFVWIAGSLICPLPTLADDAVANVAQAAATATGGHESHGRFGDSREHDHTDLCCDILVQLTAPAGSPGAAQNIPPMQVDAALPADGLEPVDFNVAVRMTGLESHGPDPPLRSWPRFANVWSQAPPADGI